MPDQTMTKIASFYKKLSAVDFCRKMLFVLIRSFRWNLGKKMKAWYYFKTTDITLGKDTRMHGLAYDIKVGAQTRFYDHCIFEFGSGSEVRIGSQVVFSYGVVFCCIDRIIIGDDVQIGEYSSLRDSSHRYDDMSKPMKYAEDISSPIVIGNNVWIGRGCLILPGTIIEEGVVVAANSVVKGRLKKDGIYGGAPAKFIKHRNDHFAQPSNNTDAI